MNDQKSTPIIKTPSDAPLRPRHSNCRGMNEVINM